MKKMTDSNMRQIVKDFVKGPLGCQCPDEVFEDIEFQMGDMDLRIFIEKRLIVRLLPFGKKAMFVTPEQLLKTFKEGQHERDLKGFNRFRLVLISRTGEDSKKRLERLSHEVQGSLKKANPKEDRMHLHVVDINEVPEVLKVMAGIRVI